MKATKAQLVKFANLAVTNAPNPDWKGRGVEMVGKSRQVPVRHPHDWNDDKGPIGEATVAHFKFKKAKEGNTSFVGFMLGVMDVMGQKIHTTYPVINDVDERDWNCTGAFTNRFCPECLGFDTVKTRRRRVHSECIMITYYCKCGYKDVDAFD